ncbi:sugar phosphate isomerase/epimerase family protein [Caldifermentibacillus hisashii]|uniref:sugar phosphate isomerase/epimerase family protein n=1 Tax=Caldifermentibacillus hisashii TaxID=996558 RepID=UPI001C0FF7FD|nr:TIM barrel protein [Caldifermentibacillus hisashii]MBU5342134.1 sugar phosphate isomerase/epimerase [Caldifermentibacillus hisashii]
MNNIKLGVSLYSFTNEYIKGQLTLEDCIRAAAEFGAEGFELVGTQMLRSYPYATDKVIAEINSICNEYGIQFISYGANTDRGMRSDRDLSEEEMLQSAILDLGTASKLGCKYVRVQYLLSPQSLGKLAPYAESYGVKAGVEIHNPETPTSPIMQEYLDVIEKTGSKNIGFVPDFGCFATRPNKPHWDEALANGAPLHLLEMAAKLRYDGVPMGEARKRLLEAGANEAVLGAFQGMYGFVTFYRNPDFDGLKKIMPYVIYFHGKFHHINEQLEEASIPYGQILDIIKESGFSGYIMSEYEDHASGNALLMTKRHLQMERKLLENK